MHNLKLTNKEIKVTEKVTVYLHFLHLAPSIYLSYSYIQNYTVWHSKIYTSKSATELCSLKANSLLN